MLVKKIKIKTTHFLWLHNFADEPVRLDAVEPFIMFLFSAASSERFIRGQQAGAGEDHVGQPKAAQRQTSALLRPVEHPL